MTPGLERFQIVRDELIEALNKWYADDLKNPKYRSFTEGAIQQLLPGVDDIERAHRDVQYIQQSLYALEGVRGVLHYVKKLRDMMRSYEVLQADHKRLVELKAADDRFYEKSLVKLTVELKGLQRSCVSQSDVEKMLSAKDQEILALKAKLLDANESLSQKSIQLDHAQRHLAVASKSSGQ